MVDHRLCAEPFAFVPVGRDRTRAAVVDLADVHLVADRCWAPDNNYASATFDGQSIRMHRRLIADVPNGHVVDHVNGNTFDNRRANLRVVTVAENNANRAGTAERARLLKAAA